MRKGHILLSIFLAAFAGINAMDNKKQQKDEDNLSKKVLRSEQGFTLYSDGYFIKHVIDEEKFTAFYPVVIFETIPV